MAFLESSIILFNQGYDKLQHYVNDIREIAKSDNSTSDQAENWQNISMHLMALSQQEI